MKKKVFKVSDIIFDSLYHNFIANFPIKAHANITVPDESQTVLHIFENITSMIPLIWKQCHTTSKYRLTSPYIHREVINTINLKSETKKHRKGDLLVQAQSGYLWKRLFLTMRPFFRNDVQQKSRMCLTSPLLCST